MPRTMKPKRVYKPKTANAVKFTPKQAKAIKSLVKHQEFLWDDTQISFTNSNTPFVGQIFSIATASGANNRKARQILIKSIELNLDIVKGTANEMFERIALVRYKPSNGNTLSYTNVYSTSEVSAVRNLNNRSDYIILKSWDFQINNVDHLQKVIRYYKRFEIPVTFGADTGTDYTTVEENNIFLVALSSSANGTVVSGNVRVRYTDN